MIARYHSLLLLLLSLLPLSLFPLSLQAEILHASSPAHRVAVLELYTSEGCSSCPPADRFLSELKAMGISHEQLLPMAFHVTYWDFIGWRDRFAQAKFDERQYQKAVKSGEKNVYTPQFMLSGKPFRQFGKLGERVAGISKQPAQVDLRLQLDSRYPARVKLVWENRAASDLRIYLAVLENDLSSQVDDGENEGMQLKHDYVVRYLSSAVLSRQGIPKQKTFLLSFDSSWKGEDLSLLAFAEDEKSGEILQAVSLKIPVSLYRQALGSAPAKPAMD